MASVSTEMPHSREEWLEKFFRYGLISKGTVYCLLGLLTLTAAIGLRKKPAIKDAFAFIYQQPYGKILLIIMALGLFGYVTMRLFQSFKDTNHWGNHTKGIFTRIGYGFGALIYIYLGIYALQLAFHVSSKGDAQKFIVTKILEFDAGPWIIGIAALITIINGFYQIYKGAYVKFMNKIYLGESQFADIFRRAGIIGFVSRGVVFIIIGYFLLDAVLSHNPKGIKNTNDAFIFLENEFGAVILGVVALGLIGYGVFMFVRAKYEQINVR